MASPKEMSAQAFSIINDLSFTQKLLSGFIVLAVLGALVAISVRTPATNNQVLFSNLSPEDASAITARLQEQRIPYELAQNGATVLVPAAKVLDTRLNLAGDGLPRGGGIGFEVFDKTNLGMTDFVQRLNYQRALQGELARTIRGFEQISEARVHLATPKESIFVEDKEAPSASVSVKLSGRGQLTPNQIQAIVNLVSSAVPGLTTDNITVVDTTGRLLFRKKGDAESQMTGTQLEYQLKVENTMREKLETLFEPVVGVGRVLARVSANVEFSRVNSTQELFDPEGQVVRSEQVNKEEDANGAPQSQGIPGVKGQLATFTPAEGAAAGGEKHQRDNVTRNYEISKKTIQVNEAVGKIARLSAVVMVDGTYEKVAGKDGKAAMNYTPRSPEELKGFEKMAQSAVGFDPERGDKVEVVGMSFESSKAVEAEPEAMDKWRGVIEKLAMPLVYLLVAAGLVLFVVRPFFRLLSKKQLEDQRLAMLEVAGEVAPTESMDEEDLKLRPMGMSDKERIYKLAQSDPDRAADLVRRWLREGE